MGVAVGSGGGEELAVSFVPAQEHVNVEEDS
jgi:hypothetical protein